jgi:Zn-dependent alcohol dehydrogenase
MLKLAVDVLRILGTAGLIGGAPAGTEAPVDMNQLLGGRKLRGIAQGDAIPQVFIPKLIELFKAGKFPFDRLVKFLRFRRHQPGFCRCKKWQDHQADPAHQQAMTIMKALQFSTYGPPAVLSVKEIPKPEPGKGEVLVQIKAAAINPSDVKNVAGIFKSPLPRVPGRDYAGVVVAGDAEKGLEVWGSGAGLGVTRDGAHAEYIVVPANSIAQKPPQLSMEQAAAVGIPYLTAWSALVVVGNIQAGEKRCSLLVFPVPWATRQHKSHTGRKHA